MEWVLPEHKPHEVDAAGHVLALPAPDQEQYEGALQIINNWRASHHFPLNTFQTTLRRKTKLFQGSVVAQRIKRMKAIQFKLRKHTKKPIALSAMQDIGGCRAVLRSENHVWQLVNSYIGGDLKHEMVGFDDYITYPKFSGYRGVHLVYKYRSGRNDTFNGHLVEIQIRSQLQHAWATAVEIVGFFRQELLKSGQGDNVWKHFFKLMAAEIAIQEKAPFGIPGIPANRAKVRDQLRRCADKIGALDYLRAIGQGVKPILVDTVGAHYYLLELDKETKELKITGYKLSAHARASMNYADVEKMLFKDEAHEAVLVSADSMTDLKRVYVNYFLDMQRFTGLVEEAVGV